MTGKSQCCAAYCLQYSAFLEDHRNQRLPGRRLPDQRFRRLLRPASPRMPMPKSPAIPGSGITWIPFPLVSVTMKAFLPATVPPKSPSVPESPPTLRHCTPPTRALVPEFEALSACASSS